MEQEFETPFGRSMATALICELGTYRATIRSAGVLYALLMAAATEADHKNGAFRLVNRAIMDALGGGPRDKLDQVKKVAHELYDAIASAITADAQPPSEDH